jgi:N-acetyl sugar amidotransferase
MNNKHKICTKTVMDTTDPNIIFDENGISDYYFNYINKILPSWKKGYNGNLILDKISNKIKKRSKNKKFDCIIGLSGGLDSSYALYVAKEIMGLRPLVFHVDAGWNTDQAVSNIERLITGLDLDLYTDVINWEEVKDLQRSFLKSQIPDQDLVQDYAFFSSLYRFAKKNKIKYILTGSNYSTECCREPEEWGGYAGIDKILVNNIHKKFGTKKLKSFPIIDIFTYKLYYKYIYGMKIIKPLNFVPYIKNDAENLLEKKFGWKKFQHKHHESRFTRFYEDYWLPRKFGFDKRKAHFSSLILTDQMTREEALERLKHSELDEQTLKNEFEYVANKLEFELEELNSIFNGENKTFRNYKNNRSLIQFGAKIMQLLGLEKRLFR